MPRRGLLLDRDGVINVDHGYVSSRENFEFMPGIFQFLNAVQDHGYRLAILTNQSGVARGYYTVDDFNSLTKWMLKELSGQGIAIDLVLASFEHAEGKIPELRRQSFWRKPNPGMVLEAIQRLNLDPARSAFLGDNLRDMQAAQVGGIGKCLYLTADGKDASGDIKIIQSFDQALKYLTISD